MAAAGPRRSAGRRVRPRSSVRLPRWVSSAARFLPPAFAGDEGEHLADRPGVEHVTGLDPPSPRRADPVTHLAIERGGAVAVAVDGQRHARLDRGTRPVAVEIQVGWG